MDLTTVCKKWKSTMTDRERFHNQMHHRPVDRSFNMEFGYWQKNYSQWQLFVENGISSEDKANRFFGFDRIETVSGTLWVHPPFEEEVVSESEDKKVIRNADGLLAEVPKDGHSTIPHFTKAAVVTPEEWKKLKSERFYYPEMVEDMVETACRLVEHALGQLLPHFRFDLAASWEDICFKNGPIVSLDFFNSVVVPRYKRISSKLLSHGVDLWYTDCDGDVRPLVPGLLEGGINCLFPFEVMGCSHPGELLEHYGGELRIMGGVDKTRRYLESLVPYVKRGGYIPFCDHRCPPDVSWQNYLYYLDLKEQLFGS